MDPLNSTGAVELRAVNVGSRSKGHRARARGVGEGDGALHPRGAPAVDEGDYSRGLVGSSAAAPARAIASSSSLIFMTSK